MIKTKLQKILITQQERYKFLQIQDVYKLLFQAAMGCEHAIGDERKSLKILEQEIAECTPGPMEPILETISPDDRIVRVNLRPYVFHNGDILLLNRKFIESASVYKGDLNILKKYWDYFTQISEENNLYYSQKELALFFADIQKMNFPALHHSSKYKKHNLPSYRVVLWKLISEEIERIS